MRRRTSQQWLAGACRRGFILFEVMLAVAVFAIGVIVLGECVRRCLEAEVDKQAEVRIRRVLENRMAEIQAGAVPLTDTATEDMKGMFTGMTLKTTREPLKRKNEDEEDLENLFNVTVQASWTKAGGEKDSRSVNFYVYQRQR